MKSILAFGHPSKIIKTLPAFSDACDAFNRAIKSIYSAWLDVSIL